MSQLVESRELAAATPFAAKTSTIVALGLAVTIIEGYDIQAIGLAAPKLIPLLGLSKAEVSWVFAASMIGLVFGAIGGGWLADRVGRRPVLLASVLAFGLFSCATLAVHDFTTLFLVRLLTGVGLGGAVPNLIAVANEVSHKSRRTLTASMMFSGMPIGGALVSLIAQDASTHMDWRLIFLIGGVLPIAIAPVIYFLLPETGRPGQAGDATRLGEVMRQLLGPGQTAVTLLLWLGFILTLIVLYLLLNWLPLLAAAKGVGTRDAWLSSFMYNLGSIPGAIIIGAAVDRYGLRRAMIASYGGAVLALVALSLGSGALAISALSAAAGFFVVANLYVLYGVAPIFYPAAMRATGSGAAVAVGRLGSIIGPLVAGVLLSLGFSASQVVLVLAPVIAVGGAAVVLLTYVRHRSDRY
jgi:AAHS family 3-hydroxyphenylpropionic acid transporter